MTRYVLLVTLVVMLWATEAMAYTIGFSNLGGNNLDRFTSYTENGYTVSARPGDNWFVAKVFGNEIPAIVAGPIYNPGVSQLTLTYDDGEQFTFEGLDLTSNVAGGTSYTIAGFLGGSGVFSETFSIDSINRFETKLFSSLGLKLVDRVTITGTPGRGTTSFNIDNIRAGTGPGTCDRNLPSCNVPEPGSIMLVGAGLVGIGFWRWRRGLD
ncbi:MAG: PEP-CTERM sorting domain-containing protein [Nitrospira sp.]|nr:PEP-CTERM sorting domain-containing protein [Nitrospira sp.]